MHLPRVRHPFASHRLSDDIKNAAAAERNGNFYRAANWYKSASVRAEGISYMALSRRMAGKAADSYVGAAAEHAFDGKTDNVLFPDKKIPAVVTFLTMAEHMANKASLSKATRIADARDRLNLTDTHENKRIAMLKSLMQMDEQKV